MTIDWTKLRLKVCTKLKAPLQVSFVTIMTITKLQPNMNTEIHGDIDGAEINNDYSK